MIFACHLREFQHIVLWIGQETWPWNFLTYHKRIVLWFNQILHMNIFYDSLTFEINLGLIQAVLTSLSRTRKGAFEISLCCCWLSGTVAFLPGSSASFVVLRNDIHHIIILICTEIVIRVPYESKWGAESKRASELSKGSIRFFLPRHARPENLKILNDLWPGTYSYVT